MKRVLVVMLIVALAGIGLSGCAAVGERVGEEIAGGIVGGDVQVDGDSVTVETEGGAVTMEGDTGEIPEGFPEDFPLPDEYDIDSATSMTSDSEANFYVNLLVAQSVKDIYEWYKAELADGGWEITSDVLMSGDGDSGMLGVKKGGTEGTVSLYSEQGSDQTEVGIILVVK